MRHGGVLSCLFSCSISPPWGRATIDGRGVIHHGDQHHTRVSVTGLRTPMRLHSGGRLAGVLRYLKIRGRVTAHGQRVPALFTQGVLVQGVSQRQHPVIVGPLRVVPPQEQWRAAPDLRGADPGKNQSPVTRCEDRTEKGASTLGTFNVTSE